MTTGFRRLLLASAIRLRRLPRIRAANPSSPHATVVELPGLDHLFQHATTGEYRDIEDTFAPDALELMSDWLSERFVKP